jgi:hypothetical protein
MRRADFDKERAKRLIAAVRGGKPVVVRQGDLLLLAGVCLSLMEWSEMRASSGGQKPAEHREMEIAQTIWDTMASLIAVKIMLDCIEIGEYDDLFEPKVTLAAQLMEEPQIMVKVLVGGRPGCPFDAVDG